MTSATAGRTETALSPKSVRERPWARRSIRPLRVAVSGPELFVDRTVELLNGMGIDARRQPSTGGLGAFRRRLATASVGIATDVFLDIYGARRLDRLRGPLARIGVPTLMLWVGSDVLNGAPRASRAVIERAWHWCVAPWLRDELAEAGIAGEVVRITPPRVPDVVPAFASTFMVLAYVPEDRTELYGLDFILEVARRRPDIPFLVLGASSRDALPSNVTAVGWVGDTDSVMAQATVYLRPTSHDGLANLVLEALSLGRYVGWTYPFPGAAKVDTVESAVALIDDLHRRHAEGRIPINDEGRDAVIEMFEPAEVREEIVEGLGAIARQRWTRPAGRVQRRIALAVLTSLRVILRAERAWKTQGRARGQSVEEP